MHPELGRRLYLAPTVPEAKLSDHVFGLMRERLAELRQAAEAHIRAEYQTYYARVEQARKGEIALLLADLDRFDEGVRDFYGPDSKRCKGEPAARPV